MPSNSRGDRDGRRDSGSARGAGGGNSPRGGGNSGSGRGRDGSRDASGAARGRDGARAGGKGLGRDDSRGGDTRGGDRRDQRRDDRRDRPGRSNDWKRAKEDQGPRSVSQARYDGPPLPEEITGRELDRSVLAQLKGLPEKLAQRVARHLAAAGMVIDSDPKTAYEHTLAARARASRLAVVREACGEAAYAAGEYQEALAELRAAKRMNGATAYLPIMADCERALGRPERALELAKSPSVAKFESAAKAEMTIVEAGARRDMGSLDAALRTLEHAPLNSQSRASWVVRLRYTYADTLLAAGRPQDALEWFHRTEAIDGDEITDAGARAAEVEKLLG